MEPRDFSQHYSTDSTYSLLRDIANDRPKPGKLNSMFQYFASLVGSFYMLPFRLAKTIGNVPVRGNPAVASIILIGIFASLVGAGTYAYFSDTEASTGNTMTAGVLDLYVNGQDTGTLTLGVSNLKPSLVNYTEPFSLRIVDNPGRLCMKIENIVCGQGNQTPAEIATENGVPKYDLANYTWFDINVNGEQKIADGTATVAQMENNWVCFGVYPKLTDLPVVQSFHLFDSVTAWAHGDDCNFTETFMVLQENAPLPGDVLSCVNDSGLTFTKKETSFPDSDVFEVNRERYITKQLNEQDSALQLEMNYAPDAGDVIEYNIDYLSGSGNHMSRIVVNGEYLDENCWEVWNGSGCGAIGYWNGVHGFGNETGTYHVKVLFSGSQAIARVTTPSSEVREDSMNITGPVSFGVESHSGHNGLFHFEYYNFKVDSCND